MRQLIAIMNDKKDTNKNLHQLQWKKKKLKLLYNIILTYFE